MPHAKMGWLVVAILMLLAAGVALALRAYMTPAEVTLYGLDLWHDAGPLNGRLLLRREAEGSGALLVKHSDRPEVYAYDPAKPSLAPAAAGAWDRATGAVADCESQYPPDPSTLRIDPETRRLRAGSREVAAAGKTAVVMRASPSGRRVAVLSATGSMTEGLLPFLAGGHPTGQRLHQTLTLPGAEQVGPVVGIPVRSDGDHVTPCWSADERFVVYYHILFYYLSVVEADPPPTNKKVSP